MKGRGILPIEQEDRGDSAKIPSRRQGNKVWVKDRRVKGGGYWRKLGPMKAPEVATAQRPNKKQIAKRAGKVAAVLTPVAMAVIGAKASHALNYRQNVTKSAQAAEALSHQYQQEWTNAAAQRLGKDPKDVTPYEASVYNFNDKGQDTGFNPDDKTEHWYGQTPDSKGAVVAFGYADDNTFTHRGQGGHKMAAGGAFQEIWGERDILPFANRITQPESRASDDWVDMKREELKQRFPVLKKLAGPAEGVEKVARLIGPLADNFTKRGHNPDAVRAAAFVAAQRRMTGKPVDLMAYSLGGSAASETLAILKEMGYRDVKCINVAGPTVGMFPHSDDNMRTWVSKGDEFHKMLGKFGFGSSNVRYLKNDNIPHGLTEKIDPNNKKNGAQAKENFKAKNSYLLDEQLQKEAYKYLTVNTRRSHELAAELKWRITANKPLEGDLANLFEGQPGDIKQQMRQDIEKMGLKRAEQKWTETIEDRMMDKWYPPYEPKKVKRAQKKIQADLEKQVYGPQGKPKKTSGSAEEERKDAAKIPSRRQGNKVWVKDRRVKGGGYWRKLDPSTSQRTSAPTSATRRVQASKVAKGAGIAAGIAAAAGVGAAGVVAVSANRDISEAKYGDDQFGPMEGSVGRPLAEVEANFREKKSSGGNAGLNSSVRFGDLDGKKVVIKKPVGSKAAADRVERMRRLGIFSRKEADNLIQATKHISENEARNTALAGEKGFGPKLVSADATHITMEAAPGTQLMKTALARPKKILKRLQGQAKQNLLAAAKESPEAVQKALRGATSLSASEKTQLMRAMAKMHTNGVSHNDLHPNNILVDKGQAQFIDFGLSRNGGAHVAAEFVLQMNKPPLGQTMHFGSGYDLRSLDEEGYQKAESRIREIIGKPKGSIKSTDILNAAKADPQKEKELQAAVNSFYVGWEKKETTRASEKRIKASGSAAASESSFSDDMDPKDAHKRWKDLVAKTDISKARSLTDKAKREKAREKLISDYQEYRRRKGLRPQVIPQQKPRRKPTDRLKRDSLWIPDARCSEGGYWRLLSPVGVS